MARHPSLRSRSGHLQVLKSSGWPYPVAWGLAIVTMGAENGRPLERLGANFWRNTDGYPVFDTQPDS